VNNLGQTISTHPFFYPTTVLEVTTMSAEEGF